MIPHTCETSLKNAKGPAALPPRRRGGSAELSCHESGDRSTGRLGFRLGFGLGQDTDYRFCTGGPDEHATLAVELRINALDLVENGLRKLFPGDSDICLGLWKTLHRGGRFLQGAALERAAEEQPRRQPIAGDVIAQVDDVARLLAAQE